MSNKSLPRHVDPIAVAQHIASARSKGKSFKAIAIDLRRHPGHLARYLALLDLPVQAQAAISAGAISVMRGYAISKMHTHWHQMRAVNAELRRKAVKQGRSREFVYVAMSSEYPGAVKIGWSRDPKQRVKSLMMPKAKLVHLIATNNGRWLEQTIHEAAANQWIDGEFYRWTKQLARWLTKIVHWDDNGDPITAA